MRHPQLTIPAILASLLAACTPSTEPTLDTPQRPHRIGAVTRPPNPDKPGEAMEWRMLHWRSADGTIPTNGLKQALAARDRNIAHWSALDDGGIAPRGWLTRGPNNVGGRTRSLLIHPTQPNRMWAGSVGGGIWHSTDSGATWTPVDDWLPHLSVGSLTFDPVNPNVIWAGTGEGYYNGDAIRGDGIYRSTDSGVTWTKLPSTDGWQYVSRIAISPIDSNLVLASVRPGGIYRSTDGGATFNVVHAAETSFQVAFDPNDPTKLIGHALYNNRSLHKALYSTNAGATWSVCQTGLDNHTGFSSRIEMAWAPSQSGWVYASTGRNDGEVWRSIDGGINWTLQTSGYSNGAGWYYNAIWVDPTDANLVVIGSYEIRRSTNGGTSFTRISNGYIITTQPHPDIHRFIPDPGYNGTTNRRLWVTTDGGMYVSSDIRNASRTGSGTWSRRELTYRTTQFYGAAGDGTSGRIVGGTQDNGTLRVNPGNDTAALTFGGDGGFCAIDWQNPAYLYGEYVNLQIHRSTDGGASADYIYSGIADAGSNANFIAPFILDPNDPTRLLAGGSSLWRTTNARAATVSWSAIKNPDSDRISAIAVAPGNPALIWVGHNDGRVWRTTNGTAATPTWFPIDNNGAFNPLPNRYVQRIVIDPADHQLVYVALGGFAPDNLWRTTNSGGSFAVLTGQGATALPPAPIRGFARHPVDASVLYAGTEVGVFASEDGGQTWATNNDGPANVSVDELVFLHGSETLLAATHGRGMWTIDVHVPSVAAFGAACAGSNGTPSLGAANAPRIGETFTFAMSNLAIGQSAWLLIGFSNTHWSGIPLPADLGVIGAPGCAANVSGDLAVPLMTGGGNPTLDWPVPADPALLAATIHASCVCRDPAVNALGITTTNGLTVKFGY